MDNPTQDPSHNNLSDLDFTEDDLEPDNHGIDITLEESLRVWQQILDEINFDWPVVQQEPMGIGSSEWVY